jgi:hypothetical protein
MKCIRCNIDSKFKDRTGKKCPSCHGAFAFEPRAGDLFTDMAFKHAIDIVSANGSVRWGVEHLYYELCRHKKNTSMWGCIVIFMLIGAICIGAIFAPSQVHRIGFTIGGVVALLLAYVCYLVQLDVKFVAVDLEKFNKMWVRWLEVHGSPDGLIVRRKEAPQARHVEADVGDYSFDRAVICDRARTVDLLLANNFHFENNCAVLSIDGYPPAPFETVRKMLKRNPRLQVFALHDCTPEGCAIAHRLNFDPSWFAGGVRAVDLGLRPHQTKRFKGVFQKTKSGAVQPIHGISPQDADWLSKQTLELAAIRPEQVMKRLFKAINNQGKMDADATDSEGTYDSFG